MLKQMSIHNQSQADYENLIGDFGNRNEKVLPFAEYQKTGYLFLNDWDYRSNSAKGIKRGIAKNLPKDVTLVVYTTSANKSHQQRLKDEYLKFMDESQLMILQVPPSGRTDFWTRDNLPVPVWTNNEFTLVDAKYYYNFEPDAFLAELFSSTMTEHKYFFEGGNFITNSRGECIVVNRNRSYPGGVSDTGAIPDSIFRNHYGCTKLTRLKHLKGIGHADEVVKFMSDDVIMTDTEEYVETLEELGYEVHMLPEGQTQYETYVNSLQVNNTLFVPSFGNIKQLEEVKAMYKKVNPNLTIVDLPTRRLANGGLGGIHCITMNYPPVEMARILESMGAEIIQ